MSEYSYLNINYGFSEVHRLSAGIENSSFSRSHLLRFLCLSASLSLNQFLWVKVCCFEQMLMLRNSVQSAISICSIMLINRGMYHPWRWFWFRWKTSTPQILCRLSPLPLPPPPHFWQPLSLGKPLADTAVISEGPSSHPWKDLSKWSILFMLHLDD